MVGVAGVAPTVKCLERSSRLPNEAAPTQRQKIPQYRAAPAMLELAAPHKKLSCPVLVSGDTTTTFHIQACQPRAACTRTGNARVGKKARDELWIAAAAAATRVSLKQGLAKLNTC